MSFLERRIGPLRVRAWGLGVNFLFNVMGLYGLSRVLADTSGGWLWLVVGAVGTLVCVLTLARPVPNESSAGEGESP